MSKDFVRFSILFDIYGSLLTDRQADVISLYYDENMSLAEIAGEFDISRQAVHDTLRIAEKALENYDAKLGLVEKNTQKEKLVKKAEAILVKIIESEKTDNVFHNDLQSIREIIEKLGS